MSTQAPARRIVWINVLTVVSATILIGAEVFGAAFAGSWAIANLFGLGATCRTRARRGVPRLRRLHHGPVRQLRAQDRTVQPLTSGGPARQARSQKARRFRALLKTEKPLVLLGAYDAARRAAGPAGRRQEPVHRRLLGRRRPAMASRTWAYAPSPTSPPPSATSSTPATCPPSSTSTTAMAT